MFESLRISIRMVAEVDAAADTSYGICRGFLQGHWPNRDVCVDAKDSQSLGLYLDEC